MMNASAGPIVGARGRWLVTATANLTAAGTYGANVTVRPFECANGSTGILCGLCAEGYASAGKSRCVACEAKDVTIQRVLFGVACALVFCLIAIHAIPL